MLRRPGAGPSASAMRRSRNTMHPMRGVAHDGARRAGRYVVSWEQPSSPSSLGEVVTGYLIL